MRPASSSRNGRSDPQPRSGIATRRHPAKSGSRRHQRTNWKERRYSPPTTINSRSRSTASDTIPTWFVITRIPEAWRCRNTWRVVVPPFRKMCRPDAGALRLLSRSRASHVRSARPPRDTLARPRVARRDRAAVGPLEEAAVLEIFKISADRHLRDPEEIGQGGHPDGLALSNDLEDLAMPFRRQWLLQQLPASPLRRAP